ncbi:glutathione S-transferase [Rhizobium sp. P38BS-XIX]|uniref:glutathione S-transferase N-terminal domain-containing protein n=1 Tax=Rhizobium sp. P38BS-XIX TaxID=2726740 RepID=UPI001456BF88|nr:glutathione S-transferase [Rhizobium sp. P38BS-XIX]
MLKVNHLNNSRSQRVLWMLDELELEYEICFYKRRPTMFAPAELQKIHPLGKSPIIEDTDSDGQKVIVVESGAICEYLVSKAGGKLGPSSCSGEVLKYREFLHYAEGSVMPVLFALLVLSQVPLLGRKTVKRVQPLLDVHLDYVEAQLSSRPWFAGAQFTAADIMMSFPLEAARSGNWLGSKRPATIAWLDRIHSRHPYQRALEKGGHYAFL